MFLEKMRPAVNDTIVNQAASNASEHERPVFDGTKLKEAMKKAEFEASDLAYLLHISTSAMYKKLAGKRDFTWEEMRKISLLLNLSQEEFDACFFPSLSIEKE